MMVLVNFRMKSFFLVLLVFAFVLEVVHSGKKDKGDKKNEGDKKCKRYLKTLKKCFKLGNYNF